MGMQRRYLLAAIGTGIAATAGCVPKAQPDPAVIRETPPPWPAPRDAVSYIAAAGLPQVPLNATDHQHVVTLTVSVAGESVTVPAYLGQDRLRAVQAPCHTHDESAVVWLEGDGADTVTLGQLFTVWGVRFSATCLGALCGRVQVVADGTPVSDPVGLVLSQTERVDVVATTA